MKMTLSLIFSSGDFYDASCNQKNYFVCYEDESSTGTGEIKGEIKGDQFVIYLSCFIKIIFSQEGVSF